MRRFQPCWPGRVGRRLRGAGVGERRGHRRLRGGVPRVRVRGGPVPAEAARPAGDDRGSLHRHPVRRRGGATADVAFEIAQQEAFAEDDDGPFTPFDVPGFPGARGFHRGADDVSHGHNIVFADGRHTYFLGLGAERPAPTRRDDAIAAAQALYQRVQGR
jgi:hypothetical protein